MTNKIHERMLCKGRKKWERLLLLHTIGCLCLCVCVAMDALLYHLNLYYLSVHWHTKSKWARVTSNYFVRHIRNGRAQERERIMMFFMSHQMLNYPVYKSIHKYIYLKRHAVHRLRFPLLTIRHSDIYIICILSLFIYLLACEQLMRQKKEQITIIKRTRQKRNETVFYAVYILLWLNVGKRRSMDFKLKVQARKMKTRAKKTTIVWKREHILYLISSNKCHNVFFLHNRNVYMHVFVCVCVYNLNKGAALIQCIVTRTIIVLRIWTKII